MTLAPEPVQPPAFPHRPLGRTGLKLPVLGLGVAGPLASPLAQSSLVSELVKTALVEGITLFDSAPFYGEGRAEQRLGTALGDTQQDGITLFSKGGTRHGPNGLIKDFSENGLRAQLSETLSCLPKIDVFFLHGPSKEALSPALMTMLETLRSEGLFHHLGIAGRGPEIDRAIEIGGFDVLMAPVHFDLSIPEIDRLERARKAGLGVVGIESLLPATGKPRLSLRPLDLWYSARALKRRVFNPFALRADPVDCLNWALTSGLADTVLVGTTRPENLRQNIEIARKACG